MNKIRTYIGTIAMLVLTAACYNNATDTDGRESHVSFFVNEERDSLFASATNYSDSIAIKYAKGIKVEYTDSGTINVVISHPQNKVSSRPVRLVLRKSSKGTTCLCEEKFSEDHTHLSIPIKGAICMTALQLSNFTAIGTEDKIVGITSLRHLFNPKIKKQTEDGYTFRIGMEGTFDVEKVLAASPDIIFTSESKHGGFEQLKDCGIPLIPHHGYSETDPLGQAEWIKLTGLLCGEERRANAVFADIERKYHALKDIVRQKAKHRPTVLSGRELRNGWYVVGGNSYMAHIFADAGADYFLKDNDKSGGLTLDFESVYAQAMNIEFWQTDGSFDGEYSRSILLEEDPRYGDLRAFKEKKVIYCNLAQCPYRELSPVEPHYLLADFVKAFHPEILPYYTPRYYRIIE